MNSYNKTIAAFLSAFFALTTGFGFDFGQWSNTEIVGALGTVIGAGLVYLVPNKS